MLFGHAPRRLMPAHAQRDVGATARRSSGNQGLAFLSLDAMCLWLSLLVAAQNLTEDQMLNRTQCLSHDQML